MLSNLSGFSIVNPKKRRAFQEITGTFNVPEISFASATTSSVVTTITNYDASITYAVSSSAGSASRVDDTVTVSGLTSNQSVTTTVTATGSTSLEFSTTTPSFPSLPATPTLSRSGGTTTTVSVVIGNYDAGLTYTIGSTVGSASRSGDAIDVTGLTEGQAVTVTATASNSSGNSSEGNLATSAVPATPTISFASATSNSMTFTITNYNSSYTYSVSSSAGSASRSGNTISVTGLSYPQTVTAYATATANGISSAQGSASGSTIRSELFMVPYDNGNLVKSTNGTTWTQTNLESDNNSAKSGIAGNGSGTWIVTGGSFVWVSTNDGATQFSKYSLGFPSAGSAQYINGVFVVGSGEAYGGLYYTSTNGTTWTQRTASMGPNNYMTWIGSNGSKPSSAAIASSYTSSATTNGLAYITGTSATAYNSPINYPYSPGIWEHSAGTRFIVGTTGSPNLTRLYYSTSMSGPWTERTFGTSFYNSQIESISGNSSRIIIVGGDNLRATTTSSDLTGFTNYGGPNGQASNNSIRYGPGLGRWVASGTAVYTDGGIVTSTNGTSWSSAVDPLGTSGAYRPVGFA